jgi:response regulator RpfG family c-di-GMP phosphodiesterase
MKPMSHNQLFHILYNSCKTVYNQKELLKYKNSLEIDKKSLVLELSQKNEEIMMTQQVSIEAIAGMVESYDDETGVHIRRIKSYVQSMIESLNLSQDTEFQKIRDILAFSSTLHDIGKLMIPKKILTKPAKLNDEEFEIIKQHARLGGEVLISANAVFKEKFHKDSFLKTAGDIAMYHHERWDGKGYPSGLKETEIPLSARIVAVADVYDAIRSKRVYKDGMSHDKACQIIKEERAKAFDPYMVDVFLQTNEKFAEIFDALQ